MPYRFLLAVCVVAWCSPAMANYLMMFERDADVASNEVAFRNYATYADLLANVTTGPDVFSPINVAGNFSTKGLTYDGSRYIMMFERETDAASNEVAFRSYATIADLFANTTSAPDVFSPIDVAGNFSTKGLTYDGSRYIMMFERETDVASNEVAFRSYATFADLLANVTSGPDVFSPIDVAGNFSTSGLTYDGSRYITMFERETDVASNEVAFRTYATYADLLANVISAPDVFSPINVAGDFSTSGLSFTGPFDPPVGVPEPTALALVGLGFGLLAVRRRALALA